MRSAAFRVMLTSFSMAWLLALLSLLLSSPATRATAKQTLAVKPYVVYMGSSSDRDRERNSASLLSSHLEMLSSVIPREEKERVFVGHSYSNTLKGFSALLTKKEAKKLSEHPRVVSVFPDRVLQLHTTRSWEFLEAEAGSTTRRIPHRASDDVIIGVIDTGIWPESPSFNDAGIGPIPSRWRGACTEGADFKKYHCNRKLIGARYYTSLGENLRFGSRNSSYYKLFVAGSARDTVGHGTHTASTAVGSIVTNASYYGLAKGTAKGGSPSSRIAAYKACSAGGCSSSSLLKAIDDAVEDGVDIISISIGMSSIFQPDFLSDPIAIGAFHAFEKGVLVVCSGGNDGPDPFTVINSAPWILTVAASSIDRSFQSSIILGNGNLVKGSAINFSNHTRSTLHPMIFGGDAASEFTPVYDASNCYPGSLDTTKVTGKIVVCVDRDPTVTRREKKMVAEGAGASGLILIDDVEKGVSFDSGTFPFSEVGKRAGAIILKYVNSSRSPSASILPSRDVYSLKPAPVVAYFSSRGPGSLTESVLKPDIMAPGVGILASSAPPTDRSLVPPGRKLSNFAIKSGTSMACPHVAGTAAFVKSVRPKWTPSMLKSALMTTATIKNNAGGAITSFSGKRANYHEMGAGEITPSEAINPGLVYETTATDYLLFLCYHGYKERQISIVAGRNFTCPANSSDEQISDINYPSISVAKLDPRRAMTVKRSVINVGPANSAYTVTVDAPAGLVVKVTPAKLVFSGKIRRATFEISFNGSSARKGYQFGHLVWSDGIRAARSVFVVNVA